MVPPGEGLQYTDPAVLEKQLRVYAQELHDLYIEEKKRREDLAEEKIVLEYKLRELAALNKLFQQHLEQRQRVEAVHLELISRLRSLLSLTLEGEVRQKLQQLVAEAEAAMAGLPLEAPQKKT